MNLILLPGMDGTGELFDPLLPEIPDDIRPIVVPYPGDEQIAYPDLVDRVRHAIPKDEPYVVLGESFSGPIATWIASENHDQLRGLIFACSFVTNPSTALGLLKPLVPYVSTHSPAARVGRNFLLGTDSQAIKDLAEQSLSKVEPDVVRFRMNEIANVDAKPALARVTKPVMYLQASDDRLVLPRSADEILRIQTSAERVIIDGSHLLLQCNPRDCSAAIARFVKRVRDAA